jgi:diguanylate cyclase (GGDEF)-like protein/PAS domain S-box-containing protein
MNAKSTNTDQFHVLAEHSPDAIARYDHECRRLYVNEAFSQITGRPAAELLGEHPAAYATPSSGNAYKTALRAVLDSGEGRDVEHTWLTGHGRTTTSHFRLTPELGEDGRVVSVLAVGRDVSRLKESEQQLQWVERMARIGHWQWDYVRQEARLSAETCRIFGQAPDWNATLEEAMAFVVDEDRDRVRKTFRDAYERREAEISYTYRIRSGNGTAHLRTHAHVEYGPDGAPQRLTGITQDISELKGYESRLHEVAFHDSLTGLPNRALLNERMGQALTEAARREQLLGVLVLDLDRVKEINTTHGHGIGDRLLKESAQRLSSLLRDYDTVARLGGVEFAIVLPEVRQAADLSAISTKILEALARPFVIDEQELFISANVGIAIFPADGRNADSLLQHADTALNTAKARGRAGYRFYSAELTAKTKDRAALESALRRALPEGELAVFYQPKIDLANGKLVGAEALLRWNHPSLGLVPPDKFIGIAEDTGLIVDMGAWVLTESCIAARRWNLDGERELKIAVNLSPVQFRDDDLVDRVWRTLAMTRCQPHWIELEITESLLIDDGDGKRVHAVLTAFRDLGISIAIDDFGTGYSALSYLKRFPIDVLKIDRSFTRDLLLERDSTALVKAIIGMARSLRLKLVAEGIETEAQERFLQAHGCQLGQGYRYGKPMPIGDFEAHPLMGGPVTQNPRIASSAIIEDPDHVPQ